MHLAYVVSLPTYIGFCTYEHHLAGAVLSAFGAGLFLMPHMITTDREGNLWVTDVGLHQVRVQTLRGAHVLAWSKAQTVLF